jgi:hypothetical protein
LGISIFILLSGFLSKIISAIIFWVIPITDQNLSKLHFLISATRSGVLCALWPWFVTYNSPNPLLSCWSKSSSKLFLPGT